MFEATAPHFVSSDQRWFCLAGDLSAAAASLIHLSRSVMDTVDLPFPM